MEIFCHGTSLPVENNSFSLDPDLKDAWGLPALRLTYKDHPDDLKLGKLVVRARMSYLTLLARRKNGIFPAGSSSSASTFSGRAAWETIQDVGDRFRPPDTRREESFSLRWQQPGDLGPRAAHHDHRGAGIPRR